MRILTGMALSAPPHTHTHTDRQTDRKTDRHTQTDTEVDTDAKKHIQRHTQTVRCTIKHQKDAHIDTHTHTDTYLRRGSNWKLCFTITTSNNAFSCQLISIIDGWFEFVGTENFFFLKSSRLWIILPVVSCREIFPAQDVWIHRSRVDDLWIHTSMNSHNHTDVTRPEMIEENQDWSQRHVVSVAAKRLLKRHIL